jgi:hypothetical protein
MPPIYPPWPRRHLGGPSVKPGSDLWLGHIDPALSEAPWAWEGLYSLLSGLSRGDALWDYARNAPFDTTGTIDLVDTSWGVEFETTFDALDNVFIAGADTNDRLLKNVTVVLQYRKTDGTARNTAAFGTTETTGTQAFYAQLPAGSGHGNFSFGDHGGDNRLVISNGTFDRQGDNIWAFRAGDAGLAVYLNGIKILSSGVPVTRSETSQGDFSFYSRFRASAYEDNASRGFSLLYTKELSDQQCEWLTASKENLTALVRPDQAKLSPVWISAAGGDAVVTPDDVSLGVTSDQATVAQTTFTVTPVDASLALTSDQATVAQNTFTVSPVDVSLGITADQASITQDSATVTPNDASLGVTADATTVVQTGFTVSPVDASLGVASDQATVAQTTFTINPVDASLGITADQATVFETVVVLDTYHVRPGPDDIGTQNGDSTPIYGTGDGGSYTNAFDGLNDPAIPWDAANLVLVIHGFHCRRALQKSNAGEVLLPTGGTATRPAIIRCDGDNFGGEKGVIGGCANFSNEGSYTNHGTYTNVWHVTLASGDPHKPEQFLFERTGAGYDLDDFTKLDLHPLDTDLATTLSNLDAADGEFYWDDATKIIYVNPLGDADPTDKLLHGHYGYWAGGNSDNTSPAHVIWYRCHFFAPRWLGWKTGFNDQWYSECEISYSDEPAKIVAVTQRITFDRCNFHDCGSGFYPRSPAANTDVQDIVVADTEFTRIGHPSFLDSGAGLFDAHAISAQSCLRFKVKDNIVDGAGKAFEIWISSSGQCNDTAFLNNFVKNPHNANGRINYITSDGGSMNESFETWPDSVSMQIHYNYFQGPQSVDVHKGIMRCKYPETVTHKGNVVDGNGTVEEIQICAPDDAGTTVNVTDSYLLNPRAAVGDRYWWIQDISKTTVTAARNVYAGSSADNFYLGGVGDVNFSTWQAHAKVTDPDSIVM